MWPILHTQYLHDTASNPDAVDKVGSVWYALAIAATSLVLLLVS